MVVKLKQWIAKRKFVIGKILIIFLLPITITIILYPPLERIIFNGKNYQQSEFKIENFFQKIPTIRNLLADIFSVPLLLDWYKVSIENNSIQKDSDCLINSPPVVQFSFTKGDPRKYNTNLKENILIENNWKFESKYPAYYLKGGEKAFFIAPSWEEYSINGGLIFLSECAFGAIGSHDIKLITDYNISIKPYWRSWIVRLFIIFIFWVFLLSSFITIKKWIKKPEIKI